jgi:hypothetical protein
MFEQFRDVLASSAWMEAAMAFGLRLLVALIVLWIGIRLAHFAAGGVERLSGRAALDTMLANFFRRVVKVLLIVVVAIAVIDMIGIPVTSLLAVLAAAGLAVGLALRDSLSNIAGAVMIVTLRPFNVGDFVDAGGVSGTVERVEIFHTTLRTPDNRVISVPNSRVANANIINFTAREQRRSDLIEAIKTRLEAGGCSIPFPEGRRNPSQSRHNNPHRRQGNPASDCAPRPPPATVTPFSNYFGADSWRHRRREHHELADRYPRPGPRPDRIAGVDRVAEGGHRQ